MRKATIPEHLYPHMLQEYYVARVREIAKRRAEERAQIRTRSQVLRLQEEVRRKLRKCFGPFPPRTPLNAQVTGRVERKDYAIEKIIYESRPGLQVTANLYLPRKSGAHPGVLAPCGHAPEGKAARLYQAFAQNLARLGFVVLIYDPLSQGERVQYPKREGVAHPKGCCQEHNMMGNQMSLIGEFFGMWRLWDGIRGLDYLLSRPEVDRRRIGVTGNSGGGTLSTYLTAFDHRFTMAAPSCFVTTYLSNLENELPADSEQIPPGMLAAGLDMADFFIAHAPRPTLLLGQRDDYFDTRGLLRTFEELRRIYRILGEEEKIELFIGPRGHGYHQENREAMYRFFCKHARVVGDTKEPRLRVEKQETLFATSTGQLWRLGAKRVFDFIADKARQLEVKRRPPAPENIPPLITRLLALPKRASPPHYRNLRSYREDKWPYRFCSPFAVETEPGIQAILLYFSKRQLYWHLPEGEESTLYIPHISTIEDLCERLVPRGLQEFFALDVRGIGHSRALTCHDANFFAPYGNDYFYASHGEMLGEPYSGRRVHDLLATLDLLQSKGYRRVHLVGRGLGAITATFAASLHPLITRVTLRNALLSYHELTQVPVQSWPLSAMVRGILEHLDLPDCYRLLRSKKLSIIEPWDSQMRPWKKKALDAHLVALGLGFLRPS